MGNNIKGLKDLGEVAKFWSGCIERLGDQNDQSVAYDMVRVVGNDHWHEWYNEGKGDPLFVQTYDLVADLETPIKRELSRDEMWRTVKKNVMALSLKYCN